MIIIPKPVQDSSQCISNITNHGVMLCVDIQSACLNSGKMCGSQMRANLRKVNSETFIASADSVQSLLYVMLSVVSHLTNLTC